jgi:hypothetical protein
MCSTATNADDRESASVAHIYGQNLAAAESMTAAAAPWGWYPAALKPTADQELLNGINRFVIHESAHQPLIDKVPGMSLGPFGQWFNRNETWAEQAGPWIDYLARSSYMLQQGRFSADIMLFYGEDNNLTQLFQRSAPNIPPGYGFDYVNADTLIHELSVLNGRIVTKSGMEYKVLSLDPNGRHMSLPVLRAIDKLVGDGVVVVGPKPIDDPSLADNQEEFTKLSTELFGDGSGVHKHGKGAVYAGRPLSDALNSLKVGPDFDYAKDSAKLEFAHRKLSDADIYFVDNRSDHEATVEASFRVAGRAPELWYAESGASAPVSFKVANGRTTVPLSLEPWGAVFVVFSKPTTETSRVLPPVVRVPVAAVEGPWTVAFQPGRGAPASIRLNELSDWSLNDDPGVKYFSGVATYTKTVDASPDWFKKGSKLWIDLGDVKNLAVVSVNGKDIGETWHRPYRVDVTSALRPGQNEIAVKVINAWVNRLIGDEQPGATKVTFTSMKRYNANSPLQPSGLLGPVSVVREEAH